jgi:RNA polymerase sigma factor (sigma-70 family)
MVADDRLAADFETHRGRLRSLAYRMLGSLNEADDAVQEAWLRLSRSPAGEVSNLGAWLTTVTGRICLDMLRARRARHEEPRGVNLPDPIVRAAGAIGPEDEAMLADSVGFALLVVLDELSPAERLAFVLHDMFAVPYRDIALIAGRSPAATKMLASRARRRLQEGAPQPESDIARQRAVVGAYLAASRAGDFGALVAVLDPDVVLRADGGEGAPRRRSASGHSVPLRACRRRWWRLDRPRNPHRARQRRPAGAHGHRRRRGRRCTRPPGDRPGRPLRPWRDRTERPGWPLAVADRHRACHQALSPRRNAARIEVAT